jgi:hypothetical protein
MTFDIENIIEYPYLKYRKKIWKEIVNYIYKDIGEVYTLIEMGAGFCDFINQFPAKNKICYEFNSKMKLYANNNITFIEKDVIFIDEQGNSTADLVFASNFLEHIDRKTLTILMPKIYNVLKQGGKLVLIQPNYNLCKKKYFDDITHKTIFDDKSIRYFLKYYGFIVNKVIPGFLPFQMKLKLPKFPILVRMYLTLPIKPGAAQMYVVAEKK